MSLDWPPKNALTGPGPPYFEKVPSMVAERGEILNTLTFSIPSDDILVKQKSIPPFLG